MRSNKVLPLIALLALCLCSLGYGWHAPGHKQITALAVDAVPDDMPAFFIEGVETVTHCACDPDFFREPFAEAEVTAAERPEHYFDIEWLNGAPIPPDRAAFLNWCADNDVDVASIGLLPYAVTEWTQRLTVAFAEYRRYPDNPAIQAKCLVYAGLLSHYAQDLCQPLHTTIHYDGRVGPDGKSPGTGIHTKVDALIGKLAATVDVDVDSMGIESITPFDNLFEGVVQQLLTSHELVDVVYRMEPLLPDYDAPFDHNADGAWAAVFAAERLKAATHFTARLYLTAWVNSEKLTFPDWYARPPVWAPAVDDTILIVEPVDGP